MGTAGTPWVVGRGDRSRNSAALTLLWVVASAGLGIIGCTTSPSTSATSNVADASAPPTVAPAASIARADPHYAFSAVDRAFEATNARQRYVARVDETGLSLRPSKGSAWSVTLSVAEISGGAQRSAPTQSGERIERAQGAATEWYSHDARGVEQGFTFAKAPDETGRLRVALEVGGGLRAIMHGDHVDLVDQGRTSVIGYGNLAANDADGRALTVALRIVGGRIVLDVDAQGARYPVEIDPTAWSQQTELTPTGVASIGQGAIAYDGTTIVATGYDTDETGGLAFVGSGFSWTEQSELNASPAPSGGFGAGTEPGFIAIDGTTAVIGSQFSDGSAGASSQAGEAYVFVRSGTTWSEQAKLVPSDSAAHFQFGTAVAISGNTIGVTDNDGQGSYLFTRSGTVWTQASEMNAGNAIAVNGTTVLVGNINDSTKGSEAGAVYQYTFTGGPATLNTTWTASDASVNGFFGASIRMDATDAIVGGNENGAAYVFHAAGTTWAQQGELSVSGRPANDSYTGSVAISGSIALVAAVTSDTTGGTQSGAVYAFTRTGTTWAFSQKIIPDDATSSGLFGIDVGISGTTAVVAAYDKAYVLSDLTVGTTCTVASDCTTGHCVEGVCCDSPCAGVCESCRASLNGNADGFCGPVTSGNDDAAGSCAAVRCVGATSGTTASCNGEGACAVGGTTSSCGAYACNAARTACNTTCSLDTDCATADYCAGGPCRAKTGLGVACTGSDSCLSGYCTDDVCCTVSPCPSGTCGSAGTCVVANGQTCTTNANCASGNCVSGVCCNTACAGPCAGSCSTGTCAIDAVGAAGSPSCAPYTCNGTLTSCPTSCTSSATCAAGDYCNGTACVAKLANGVATTSAADCVSGNLSDGVCCNSACGSQCQACDVSGSVGTCTTVTSGAPHGSRAACSGSGACVGTCNGSSATACAFPTTSCRTASCASGTETLAASCSAGSCPAPVTSSCDAYVCGSTACKTSCATNADCVAGDYCNGTTCATLLTNGATSASASDCASGNLSDGVCCNTACGGQCEACNVSGKVGTCSQVTGTPVSPRAPCASDGSACAGTCSTSLTACTFPTSTTSCRAASCASGTETLAASCSGTGSCPTVSTASCGAYVCGTTACKTTCAASTDCAAGDYCNGTTCATKLGNGVTATSAADCASGNLSDGVCCNSACGGQCEACNVSGKVGTCSQVTGAPVSPRTACTSDGSSCAGTCSTSLTACTFPTSTTSCRAASCASGTETLAASCTGTGVCPAVSTTPCGAYICGASACKTTCATSTDCAASDYCNGTTCATKLGNGTPATSAADCSSGYLADGVCCNSGCTAQCQACDVAGSVGTCAAVTSGAPHGSRTACTTDGSGCGGTCGASSQTACTYPTTSCRTASCSTVNEDQTSAASCDGAGHCPTAVVAPCSPFVCGTTACKTTCTGDTDCATGLHCASGFCGTKLAQGAACAVSTDCATGLSCTDGVCCNSACSGQCQACDVVGSIGTCAAVVSGAPHGSRTACTTDGTSCGGACAAGDTATCTYPTATASCRSASCALGSETQTAAAGCDGAGHCPGAVTTPCAPFVCGATACKTTCASASDCASSDSCNAGVCVGKLANGAPATSAASCASALLVDGVCCDEACAGQCQACDVAGHVGTCTTVASGAPHAARSACATDGSTCGGSCNGTSATACGYASASTTCRAASCTAGVATSPAGCNGAGTCTASTLQSCAPLTCDGTVCAGSCASDTDCVATSYCDTTSGACVAKAVAGAACAASDGCLSGPCVDGVCCNSACTGQCEACTVAGHVGTCTAVVGAPVGSRAACASDGSACGGSCDGTNVLGCVFPGSSTSCGSAGCIGGVSTPASSCGGAGSCASTTPTSCAPYACNAAGVACATSCASDADCDAVDTCASGLCVAKKATGLACATTSDCNSGFCADGVCCDAACTGACNSCNQIGSVGTCTAVDGLVDPHGVCATGPCSDVCHDGACGFVAASTACGTSCSGASLTAGTCSGSDAACASVTTAPCPNDLVCADATSCKTSCVTSSDCASGVCDGTTNTCVTAQDAGVADAATLPVGSPLAPGGGTPTVVGSFTSCTKNGDCASGFCVEGLCCNEACGSLCSSCALPFAPGICTVEPLGLDVKDECGAAGSCTAACNGSNACTTSTTGALCAPSKCTDTSHGVGPEFCSTPGQACPTSEAIAFDCGAYACASIFGACKVSCVTTSDCADNFVCDATSARCVSASKGKSGCAIVRAGVGDDGSDARSTVFAAFFLTTVVAIRRRRAAR